MAAIAGILRTEKVNGEQQREANILLKIARWQA